MQTAAVPFRLSREQREARLPRFNERSEIRWFGLRGAFEEPGTSTIGFTELQPGLMGGGGTNAINGGVIAAGFDAVFVLAGLGHYESEVVVTLELSVRFLSLAVAREALAFRGRVVRSSKHFAFAEGYLSSAADASAPHFATATAVVAPVLRA